MEFIEEQAGEHGFVYQRRRKSEMVVGSDDPRYAGLVADLQRRQAAKPSSNGNGNGQRQPEPPPEDAIHTAELIAAEKIFIRQLWLPGRLRPLSRDSVAVVAVEDVPELRDMAERGLYRDQFRGPSVVLGPTVVVSTAKVYATDQPRPWYSAAEARELTALYSERQRSEELRQNPTASFDVIETRLAKLEAKKR